MVEKRSINKWLIMFKLHIYTSLAGARAAAGGDSSDGPAAAGSSLISVISTMAVGVRFPQDFDSSTLFCA